VAVPPVPVVVVVVVPDDEWVDEDEGLVGDEPPLPDADSTTLLQPIAPTPATNADTHANATTVRVCKLFIDGSHFLLSGREAGDSCAMSTAGSP
jgi:hypothetical protein